MSCGTGSKTRYRSISTPSSCGGTCAGSSSRSGTCGTSCCPGKFMMTDKYHDNNKITIMLNTLQYHRIKYVTVNCLWGNWQAWNGCTKMCGSGTTTRTRIKIREEGCGGSCSGQSSQNENCNEQCCSGQCPTDLYPES